MKITNDEAQHLIDTYCGDEPLPDAQWRAVSHDWERDPRTDQIGEVVGLQDEVERVLYGKVLNPTISNSDEGFTYA